MAKDRTQSKEGKAAKSSEENKLDEALDDTFPASDPPASTSPGHGITGPEVKQTDEQAKPTKR